jgi:protein-S-isoprenylcysteine O-methyltransferase Ste14
MHEEDMKWTANIIIGAAFFMLFVGVILGQTFEGTERLYIITFSVIVAFVFAGVGAVIHYIVMDKIKRTTIVKRQARWK